MLPSKDSLKVLRNAFKKEGFCVVFESDLNRCWPSGKLTPAEPKTKIKAFAETYGWSAAILTGDFGIRAIFRKSEF